MGGKGLVVWMKRRWMILRYGWTGRGRALSSMAKSWSWKMESFRLTNRKLAAKIARIAGSRMMGVRASVWVMNWSARARGIAVPVASRTAL